ncbi:cellulose biosynthesis protein BcsQ [Pseudomonas sp. NC26]|uniref:Cellulose synthase operon protein YhjQ n=1 Tax=Pseudomonas putida TaxID=303 RepID=A0A7W2KXF1_PSEPU|nr:MULTISPECIES: cellulose biosynthesis protein BcsQ [Pseudomonas]MBA6114500.1 cellulose synthase operon protein YhjQ [Pseudomonas putida]MCZ9640283.1 cellulose synthase operon protein YhjQ [Pseudomonas putida]MEC4879317.1 cellulose biosynthesis protein BcsQ [Pseudomonas sp. NC26]PZQ37261.1 MAG: cellulose synthase operon protein YhjQ [Pseudomonas putida]QNL85610.1 Cellulose biosynthesis protein BcsQ [Pseudomonas putida]
MITLALHGLRGGLGRSALVAALGYALRELGERVLLIDLCPENLLGLHYNLPLDQRDGWARSQLQGRPFGEPLYEVLDGLCLMPFGEVAQGQIKDLSGYFDPDIWRTRQAALAEHFDWLLFDLPHPVSAERTRAFKTDMQILVAEAEMTSHVLLGRQQLERYDLMLVNRFDPASSLQGDVLMVWRDQYRNRLPLQLVHRDEAFAEAFACKAPVGHYAPQSLASRDVQSLAVRCLARRQA